MSDPTGKAPELVWPALRRPALLLIYLDLNHWIALAKANSGHREGDRFIDVLSACRKVRREGLAIFPLSASHYVEVSKIKDPRQRQDIATVMEELSGFLTLIDASLLKRLELDATLGRGVLAADPMLLVGWGVGFAFGHPTRPTIVDGEGIDITADARQDPAVARLLDDAALMLERLALAGPTDAEAPSLRDEGWDPEAAWRVAESRANEEREQAKRFDDATDKNWRRGRLRDAVCAREVSIELWEAIQELLRQPDTGSLEDWFTDVSAARRFVRSMPTSEVAIELKTAMHRNAQRARAWSPNDVLDMDAMSLAVPYCDIVVTERHAADVVTRAHLEKRMDTLVLTDLVNLLPLLPAHSNLDGRGRESPPAKNVQ